MGTDREAFNEAMDRMVSAQMASPEIFPGDSVEMEYAAGVTETATVMSIEDGMVYGVAEDMEPLCAPLANCKKNIVS